MKIHKLLLLSILTPLFIMTPSTNVFGAEPTPVTDYFGYTGTTQTYTVPYNNEYTITLAGGSGGSCSAYSGGSANHLTIRLDLKEGQVLTIKNGGAGGIGNPTIGQYLPSPGGWNGGMESSIGRRYNCVGPGLGPDQWHFQGQTGQYQYDGDAFEPSDYYKYILYNAQGQFIGGPLSYRLNGDECHHDDAKPKHKLITAYGCWGGCKCMQYFFHGHPSGPGVHCNSNNYLNRDGGWWKNHRSEYYGGGAGGGGATEVYLDGVLLAAVSGGGGAAYNGYGRSADYNNITTTASNFVVQGVGAGGAGGNYMTYYNPDLAVVSGGGTHIGNGYTSIKYTIPQSKLVVVPFEKESDTQTELSNLYAQDKYAANNAEELGYARYKGVTTEQTFIQNINTTLEIVKPERLGYTFTDWVFTTIDGQFYTENGKTIYKFRYDDSMLEAQYVPIKYKVRYNGVRNTNILQTSWLKEHTYDTRAILDANTYERNYSLTLNSNEPLVTEKTVKETEYESEFKGWTRVLGLDNATNGSTNPILKFSDSDAVVQYQEKEVVVNLSSIQDDIIDLYTVFEYDTIKLDNPTYEDYEFIGWNSEPDGSGVYNTDDGVKTDSPFGTHYKPDSDYAIKQTETLYGQWKKKVTLTFDLNGGKYNGSTDKIELGGVIYNSAPYYEFSIVKNQLTAANTLLTSPYSDKYYWEKQVGGIDAYGAGTNSKGFNYSFTKQDSSGMSYRFLGWSTDPNATLPDMSIDVHNGKVITKDATKSLCSIKENRAEKLKIYTDTTLYAVWEPVLTATVMQYRALGDKGNINVKKVTLTFDKDTPNSGEVLTVAKAGEQVQYDIHTPGLNGVTIDVQFDPLINAIYNSDKYKDNANPVTADNVDEIIGGYEAKCALNRHIVDKESPVTRKFYLPIYLNEMYPNTDVYAVNYKITRPSAFMTILNGSESVEEINVTGYLYVGNIDVEGNYDASDIGTVLNDLRSKIKIRIK